MRTLRNVALVALVALVACSSGGEKKGGEMPPPPVDYAWLVQSASEKLKDAVANYKFPDADVAAQKDGRVRVVVFATENRARDYYDGTVFVSKIKQVVVNSGKLVFVDSSEKDAKKLIAAGIPYAIKPTIGEAAGEVECSAELFDLRTTASLVAGEAQSRKKGAQ